MSKARTRPLIRALLIDVSGNLHVGSTPTPHAVEALHRLRESGLPFRLCSNTSKESTQSLVTRLNKLGFGVGQSQGEVFSDSVANSVAPRRHIRVQHQHRQEVWTSIGAVAQYIRAQGLTRPYILLSPSAKDEVIRTSFGHEPPATLNSDSRYDSVIVGLAPEMFDFSHLNTAFRILKGETAQCEHQRGSMTDRFAMGLPPLIATHKAKYIQTENPAGLSLGPGPFVSALEMAAGVEAHVIGKPTRLFFQTVIDDFYASGELEQVEHGERLAVIGDDVEADLGDGAAQMGLWRVLVKTGKYRSGDENRPGTIPPDEVFDSFAEFVDALLAA